MKRGRQELRVADLSQPISHYTDAVRCGDFLFISGCVAFDEHGRIVAKGDVRGQMRQALTNMKACLDAANMTFANVAKVTIYLLNTTDRHAINPIRQEFFGSFKPASTLIGVNELASPDILVEIEAVAFDG
ncbi:MAG: RidA family protein [Betaproteobacteria bacterium]|nr:MAG: RidA family protein [Betaproteobacteria bacterium]